MTETLKQIRKLIVDGKFLEALNMIDDQIANASKKAERDADDSKTMENLRKMLEDECSRRCVLEKKLEIAIGALKRLSKGETSIIIDGVAHYPNYYAEYMIEKIEEVK